ncbi:hypothetical protein HZS55_18240 [Halosimplex rubrum]|uniref:Uncharacterized protein n=1 Tax=Halosimplex rubrum TaxID=869889 RepID=A0A7D5T7L3_9EURY|nr:hypothetical protein [Halosimplex rubrum]QLH79113.1 hypothetical protein HZS55_18240 [Halosimplex rubrum]
MEPVSEDELRRRSDGIDAPDTLDLAEIERPTYDDAGGDDSPDLNPDGSLKAESTEADQRDILDRLRSIFPW